MFRMNIAHPKPTQEPLGVEHAAGVSRIGAGCGGYKRVFLSLDGVE